MNKGIVYIIGGKKYARWALRSVISLRLNGGRAGKMPVFVYFMGKYIYEDAFNDLGCSCMQISEEDPSRSVHRRSKAAVMATIPFDKYIMIDADTYIQNDFYDMFDLIPDDGIAGIEDGNFESHLQMAKFLFVKGKVQNVRQFALDTLDVDYGADYEFPPYFNVGVIGLSQSASKTMGKHLSPLLGKLQKNENYNPHDEQLPMNSVMYRFNIPAIAIDPLFNYTKSRTAKNRKSGLHETIKNQIKIIHNKSCIESDWIDNRNVETLLNKGIDNGQI